MPRSAARAIVVVVLAVSAVLTGCSSSSAGDDADVVSSFQFGTTTLKFVGADTATDLIQAEDAYRDVLSPMDRQLLGISAAPVAAADLDAELAQLARDWNPTEIQQQTENARDALQLMERSGVRLNLPATVYLVKNDAALFSGSPYTRGITIFLPIAVPGAVLVHELWHIASRLKQAELAPLYAMVGYTPCSAALESLGPDLRDVRITNPDAEIFGKYCVTLPDAAGVPTRYSPLPYATRAYDGTFNAFSDILRVALVEVDPVAGAAVVRDGVTSARDMFTTGTMEPYFEAIGGNGLSEPFQPDEIIAKIIEARVDPSAADPASNTNPELADRVIAAVAAL